MVMPDLYELCETYVQLRGRGEDEKALFVTILLLDQLVRKQPGGELGKTYDEIRAIGDMEMVEFVHLRTGERLSDIEPSPVYGCPQITNEGDGGQAISECPPPRKDLDRSWRHILGATRGRLQRAYLNYLMLLVPSAYRQQNISRAGVGELHQWVWDYWSMRSELERAGFTDVVRKSHLTSDIDDFPVCPLDADEDGRPRKGSQSMYIEAIRP
jgi:hypothetical protein